MIAFRVGFKINEKGINQDSVVLNIPHLLNWLEELLSRLFSLTTKKNTSYVIGCVITEAKARPAERRVGLQGPPQSSNICGFHSFKIYFPET